MGYRLFDIKTQVAKPLIEALHAIDPQMVREALIHRFLDCFYDGCKVVEFKPFVDEMVKA